jgi:hypothetical protein
MRIPAQFGWRLLADAAADLPGTGCPPACSRAHELPEAVAEGRDEDEGYDGYPEAGYPQAEQEDEYQPEAPFGEADHGAGRAMETPAARPAAHRPRTTAALRQAWARYLCAEREMVTIKLLSHRTPVNPLAVDAFTALGQALTAAGYQARRTWVYNCRTIGGQANASLHAYGLAVDIDAAANPHRRHVTGPIRFSGDPSQAGRQRDVATGRAGTSFTPDQVAAVEAIRTIDGRPVFGWGGRWRSSHDAMHFEIRLTPAELQRGIAPPPVAGQGEIAAETCEAWEINEGGGRPEWEDGETGTGLGLYGGLAPGWGEGDRGEQGWGEHD